MPEARALRGATLLAVLLLSAAVPARAVDVGDLYQVTVRAGGVADEEVFREGMAAVLVRVTGRRDAALLPQLSPLIESASRYVSSYRRASAGRLLLRFDAEAIESAISAAGLPFWGEDRPATLVWLGVDRGGRRTLVADRTSGELAILENVAEQRGVPLIWPSPGSGTDAPRRLEQVWSGEVDALAAAASGYGVDGVLVGRARAAGSGSYEVDWTFVGAGGSRRLRGDLGDGVHLAADRYAALYASAAAGRRDEVDVVVSGIGTARRYAEAMKYLESLPVVRGVDLREVRPDSVVFRVAVRGGLGSLRRAMAADRRMTPEDDGTGAAAFRLLP